MRGSNSQTGLTKADFNTNIRNFWANVNWKNTYKKGFFSTEHKKTGSEDSAIAIAYKEAQQKKAEHDARKMSESNVTKFSLKDTAELDRAYIARESQTHLWLQELQNFHIQRFPFSSPNFDLASLFDGTPAPSLPKGRRHGGSRDGGIYSTNT